MSGISWRTYAIISWWCWMHVFNLACKSQFVILWTGSSSFAWWGVISCLISNMANFSLSNWLQAKAIRLINRDKKPNFTPSTSNVEKPCKEANTSNYNADICLTPSKDHCANYKFCGEFCRLTASKLTYSCSGKLIHNQSNRALCFNWIGINTTWTWKEGTLGTSCYTFLCL